MLQDLSAGEVADGAAQRIGGGDKGLTLHHIRHGDAPAGIVHLGGREEGIGGGLQQLDEIDGVDTGCHQQQHRLDKEGKAGKFQKPGVADVFAQPLEAQQHQHLHRRGDEQGYAYAAAVAAQGAHHLNKIVLRHGVEHSQQHHTHKRDAVPTVFDEKLSDRAALRPLFYLTGPVADGGIGQHHQYIQHQQRKAHPDHPLDAPAGHQLADQQRRERIAQRTDTAAETVVEAIAVFQIGYAQRVHQRHHRIQRKYTQQIYRAEEEAGKRQELHHAEAENTHRRQRCRHPLEYIAAGTVGKIGQHRLGRTGEQIADCQHGAHRGGSKALTQ